MDQDQPVAELETHSKDGLEIVAFADADAFERWLAVHHADCRGIWIKMAKKSSGIPSITWPEIVEVALCYGWIDGQRLRYDERYALQRVTPRRPRSVWSQVNTEKATALIKAGRMRPSGLAEVERAKADGRWQRAYAAQSRAVVPPDLQAFLESNPGAATFFNSLSSQNRYAFVYRLQSAKRQETRARRLAEFSRMLAERRAFY